VEQGRSVNQKQRAKGIEHGVFIIRVFLLYALCTMLYAILNDVSNCESRDMFHPFLNLYSTLKKWNLPLKKSSYSGIKR
jgi:hypothetical protein